VALGTLDPHWRERPETGRMIRPLIRAISGEASPFVVPAEALRIIGSPAIPHLIPLIADENRVYADAAGRMIKVIDPRWQKSPEAVLAVPALSRCLTSKQWFVRCAAAQLLGYIGPGAKKAVPFLVKGLADPNKKVRSFFKEAMDKILLKAPVEASEEG
jgi:HEAT repeat protein